MSNLGVTVEFGGDTSGLEKATEQASKSTQEFADKTEQASKKVGGSWAGLKPLFSGVASVLRTDLGSEGISHLGNFGSVGAGVADSIKANWDQLPPAFQNVARAAGIAVLAIGAIWAGKKFVDQTADATEAARDFARALGTSTNEAHLFKLALLDVGAGEGEFEGLAKGLVRQLRENEKALNDTGLATRDAAGNLRPLTDLTLDAIEVLGTYKEGIDRNIASQSLFGRAADASSRVLLLNRDAIEENRRAMGELHLEIGAASVGAWADWDRASDRAELSMKGFGKAIGDAVMPVLTELTDMFNSVAPAAITVLRGALSGLSTAFLALTNGIVIVWETFKAFLFSVTDPLVALGTAMVKLIQGDFKGAQQELMDWPGRVAGAWGNAFDNMASASQRTSDRIKRMWAFAAGGDKPAGDSGAPAGSKDAKVKAPKVDKEKMPDTYMGYYEAMLAEEKRVMSELTNGRAYSKAEELAFWEYIKQTATTTEKDKLALVKKTSDLEVAIAREKAQQQGAIAQNTVEHTVRMAEIQLAADQAMANAQLATGQISAEQMLLVEQDFAQRKTDIQKAALEQRMGLINPQEDPVLYMQLKQQLEEVEMQHQARMAEIRNTAAVQSAEMQMAVWEDLQSRASSLWDQGINAMMNGTLRWGNALRAIGTQIVGWFTSSVIKPMVMQWVFGESAKTGATATGTATRTAMESLAAAKSVALWAATAVKNIMASAWEAMAGAYKAIVGIPYVGPFLAPAMAAAAFVGVSAIAGNIMSAENGYDIPAGVNPLVQAHEKEMVLPAKYADVIRDQAEGGGGNSGPTEVIFKGQAMKGNLFLMHKDDMIDAVRSLSRDGSLRFN